MLMNKFLVWKIFVLRWLSLLKCIILNYSFFFCNWVVLQDFVYCDVQDVSKYPLNEMSQKGCDT